MLLDYLKIRVIRPWEEDLAQSRKSRWHNDGGEKGIPADGRTGEKEALKTASGVRLTRWKHEKGKG